MQYKVETINTYKGAQGIRAVIFVTPHLPVVVETAGPTLASRGEGMATQITLGNLSPNEVKVLEYGSVVDVSFEKVQ